jgi:hypothetical protein
VLGLFLVTLFLGVSLYLALWFVTFDNHDYYFIAPLVFPMTMLVSTLWLMKRYDPHVFRSPWAKVAFLLLLGYHAVYAMNNHEMRTRGSASLNIDAFVPVYHASELEHWNMTQYWNLSGLIDIEPIARAAGIRKDDLIVVTPDESVCSSLYLSGQRGFNEFGGLRLDSAQVALRVEKGAKYLYLLQYNEARVKALGGWLDLPLFEHNGVRVYDLRRSP